MEMNIEEVIRNYQAGLCRNGSMPNVNCQHSLKARLHM